ncbi:MAG: prolipoprotein diacylglyceryl transferase [Pseudorhodobacter sp.]|nr:prolipoprotein diacylglyceryl transferase [Pseudorhodobacter sp.]
MTYIPFPPLSPEIFALDIGGFHLALRWYALAYITGLLVGWMLVRAAIRTPRLWQGAPALSEVLLEQLLTWVIAGVILGGRIGYVLFYQPDLYLQNPLQILRVWEGGMSFHGGFLGVVIATILFCRIHRIAILPVGDLIAMVAPLGLFLGRLANFVNAELWGRATDLPWAVAFPGDAALCAGLVCGRHPSQLYEALLEGVVLGALMIWAVRRAGWLAHPGRIMGLFIAGYGIARVMVEFVRQPDAQFVSAGNPLGLAWHVGGWGLTQGQALSVPMVAVGLWLLLRARA